jgi:hypothetical protein
MNPWPTFGLRRFEHLGRHSRNCCSVFITASLSGIRCARCRRAARVCRAAMGMSALPSLDIAVKAISTNFPERTSADMRQTATRRRLRLLLGSGHGCTPARTPFYTRGDRPIKRRYCINLQDEAD